MKPASPAYSGALTDDLTHLCRLWVISRIDGVRQRFTDLDRDVPFEGDVYLSDNSFSATAIESRINSASSDMDVTVLLADSHLNYDDLQRGLYDGGDATITQVNFRDLGAGGVKLFEGQLSTVDLPNRFTAVLRLKGANYKVNKNITEKTSLTCRAKFGDARCKVDLTAYTQEFTVTSSPNGQEFAAANLSGVAAGTYALGSIYWTSGDNTGVKIEVITNIGGTVQLFLKTPYPIKPGDTGLITRGCPKTLAACTAYNNVPNYRGEPYVKALQ